ncbi:F11 receptor, tandem duplicate 1 isoform X2 [Coregonus clupeaformis]|uniref:F11 receptor, tandem duplicate 1 isoform X2 n=1 Tax=Coregonus clupeaformis TaxID=59861 RepID=UPI001BE02C34|nr:F11 receptor, tandem duplicate 1 isoform X2 [Coregonus clupeaformis]
MFVSGLVSVFLFFHATEAFTVTTSNANVRSKVNEGADLYCTHSADFGANARVEWKFRDMKGSTTYVIFDGKPTTPYADRVIRSDGMLRFTKVISKDNGEYSCEVSGNQQFGQVNIKLTVLVPPSVPMCRIPTSVTTGHSVLLSCHDAQGSPSPTYKWYKDKIPLPEDPSKFPAFKNYTYKINPLNGNLEFPSASLTDTGDYSCEAMNDAGPVQRCQAVRMDVRNINTGGIVAGVIVALLALALLGFGLWYANRKGYLPKKSESKPKPSVVYQPTSEYGDEGDGEFRQKSSFVV